MSSDSDYMAFLNKANEGTTSATSASNKGSKTPSRKLVTEGLTAPRTLKHGLQDVYYVSDSDEPFEEVALKWDGAQDLNEETFASLISTSSGAVSTISEADFDPRGQYDQVVQNVKAVVRGGNVKIFRVEGSGARVEYWVVGESRDRMAVFGLRTVAVES